MVRHHQAGLTAPAAFGSRGAYNPMQVKKKKNIGFFFKKIKKLL
jgi:hypothetical protein